MESLRSLIPSPSGLFAFEAAARHGSFTRAAEELGVTQAAVSYAIRQLETALGVTLFHRRHRGIALTENGERFFHDLAIGLAHIRRSAETLKRQRGDRHVTLSASTAFAGYWMVPRLARLRDAHPEIDLRLQTSDKDVDLRAEGISLGVRLGDGAWPAYDSALIAREEIFPVCSPAYLQAAGAPHDLTELARQKLIHLDEPFRPSPSWRDWFAAAGLDLGDDRGQGLRLNDYALVLQAALEGQGVALGWQHLTAPLVERGLLLRPLPQRQATGAGFYVVWPKDQTLSPQATTVRDWILTA